MKKAQGRCQICGKKVRGKNFFCPPCKIDRRKALRTMREYAKRNKKAELEAELRQTEYAKRIARREARFLWITMILTLISSLIIFFLIVYKEIYP